MFSKVFLAGSGTFPLSQRFAYMAVHFSAYGKGLSNVPEQLPKGSIILLDDSTAFDGHDPALVTSQCKELVEKTLPYGVLLDFQRPYSRQLQDMTEQLIAALPCPVGATENYAGVPGCAVFLSPPPANKALAEYIAPWKRQGVFLEIAPTGIEITVTEKGSETKQIPLLSDLPLKDRRLHCHYDVQVLSDRAVFSICRHKEDLAALVEDAQSLGVLGCVGFYRELVE